MITALLLLGMFLGLAAVAYWFSCRSATAKAELKHVGDRPKMTTVPEPHRPVPVPNPAPAPPQGEPPPEPPAEG